METTLTLGSIDQYLNFMSGRGSSANTLRAYRADLRDLLASANTSEIVDVEQTAAGWLTFGRTRWAPRTTKRKYSAIKSWARWAGAATFLSDYRLPDPGKAQPHPIPEGMAGVERLLAAADRNMQSRALIVLCGKMALRVGESLAVVPASFDLTDKTLRVHGKGDKVRTIPVPAACWPDLTPAMAGARLRGDALVPLSDRSARARITQLGIRAGLALPLASHDLRATAATHFYDITKDLRLVQEILGHADSSTTEIYTAVEMSAMRAAMEAA